MPPLSPLTRIAVTWLAIFPLVLITQSIVRLFASTWPWPLSLALTISIVVPVAVLWAVPTLSKIAMRRSARRAGAAAQMTGDQS